MKKLLKEQFWKLVYYVKSHLDLFVELEGAEVELTPLPTSDIYDTLGYHGTHDVVIKFPNGERVLAGRINVNDYLQIEKTCYRKADNMRVYDVPLEVLMNKEQFEAEYEYRMEKSINYQEALDMITRSGLLIKNIDRLHIDTRQGVPFKRQYLYIDKLELSQNELERLMKNMLDDQEKVQSVTDQHKLDTDKYVRAVLHLKTAITEMRAAFSNVDSLAFDIKTAELQKSEKEQS